MVAREWMQRRSSLSHDWLQNQMVQLARSGVGYLKGDFEREGFAEEFPTRLRRVWLARVDDVLKLARDFESEMSPRRYVSEPPLSQLPRNDLAWLGQLVHELWLARDNKRRLIARVCEAHRRAGVAFEVLDGALAKGGAHRGRSDVCEKMETFYRCCLDLSAAMSALPTRIEVT